MAEAGVLGEHLRICPPQMAGALQRGWHVRGEVTEVGRGPAVRATVRVRILSSSGRHSAEPLHEEVT